VTHKLTKKILERQNNGARIFGRQKRVFFLLHRLSLLILLGSVKSILKIYTFRTCIVIFAIYYLPSAATSLGALEFLLEVSF